MLLVALSQVIIIILLKIIIMHIPCSLSLASILSRVRVIGVHKRRIKMQVAEAIIIVKDDVVDDTPRRYLCIHWNFLLSELVSFYL